MLGTFRHLVVVTGCQRSGTTLLGQAIGAHPQAFMVDEPDGLYSWFHSLKSTGADTEEPWRRMVTAADTKYLKPHRRLVADGADDPPKFRDHITHLVLKAPNLVYEYDALASLGIKTNIIYPVRDPRSVVASMSKLTHIPMVRNQLALIGRHHSLATELADEMEMLADPDTPQHVKRAVVWRIKSGLQERFEARGLPVLSFRYEDFVTDPGALMSRIALHAGLAFDPAMLSHQSVYRGFGPGMTERARPIDRSSLTTWGDRLTPGEQRDVVRVTAAEMKSLGYDAEPGGQIASPAIARAGVPLEALRAPVIATGRGGSGTRLLTEATRASDVFLGNRLNASGDSVEWVDLIYEMTIQHETGSAPPCGWSALLRKKAAGILGQDRWRGDQPWGLKLPEAMLVVPELFTAFPEARLIHLVRHPVSISLRRTHMTSRTDNAVGRAVLAAAYRAAGRDPGLIESDGEYRNNALSWLYQVGRVAKFCRGNLRPDQYLHIRFEDFCTDPAASTARVAAFLGSGDAAGTMAGPAIDPARAVAWSADAQEQAAWVWDLCGAVAARFGYGPDPRSDLPE